MDGVRASVWRVGTRAFEQWEKPPSGGTLRLCGQMRLRVYQGAGFDSPRRHQTSRSTEPGRLEAEPADREMGTGWALSESWTRTAGRVALEPLGTDGDYALKGLGLEGPKVHKKNPGGYGFVGVMASASALAPLAPVV